MASETSDAQLLHDSCMGYRAWTCEARMAGLLHDADFIQLIYSGHPSGTVKGSIPGNTSSPCSTGTPKGCRWDSRGRKALLLSSICRQGTPVLLLDKVDASATVDYYHALRSSAHASRLQFAGRGYASTRKGLRPNAMRTSANVSQH